MTPDPPAQVHLVVPAGVEDPTRPSGGNVYDLRLAEALGTLGVPARRHDVAGGWPHPAPADEARLGDVLSALPDGSAVVVDGLVGCAAPDPLAAHADRLRIVLLVHLPLGDETGLAPADAAALTAREHRAVLVARTAGVVLATSHATAARVEAVHGLPGGTVRVAVPGTDPAPLALPSPDGGRLLCVASLTPRKGHRVLLEALALLEQSAPWRLTCVGPADPDAAAVVALHDTLDLYGWRDRVRLQGPLTGTTLDAAYADADLLVLPSLAEPYGMVVAEALARGVPVVASRVDGIPEALGRACDGSRPGVLVPPGEPAALAAALGAWLADPVLRGRLRAAAVDRRDTLPTWASTARSLLAAVAGSPRTVR